ncbi:MAG: radical SAM protein [Candidatus Micrarchaeia archaeon]
MCYAIPGKVVSVGKREVAVDYFGKKRIVANHFFEVCKGDFVYAQGGFVVDKITFEEAKPVLDAWQKAFQGLEQTDAGTNYAENASIQNTNFSEILQKNSLSKQDAFELMSIESENDLACLYNASNALRRKKLENSCCVHGIIEFSSYCSCNCTYCGLRVDNKQLERYRMSEQDVFSAAEFAVKKLGFKALVLQSGEDFSYSDEDLAQIVQRIVSNLKVLVFVSVGERSKACYEKLYKSGARGVLLRFETSNPSLYEKIRPGKKLEDRVNLIKHCESLGFIVATGGLIGLPGQTRQDLVNDVFLAGSLGEMVSFGPLIPHPQTPFAKESKVNKNLVFKTLAIARLAFLNSKILVTTALETLDEKAKREGLLTGANSLMINVTPRDLAQKYSIYPNKAGVDLPLQREISQTINLLRSLGRSPTDLSAKNVIQ